MKKAKITAAGVPGTNWTKGAVTLPNGRKFLFEAKHFEEPSHFGIDGGRISKLFVRTAAKRLTAFNYERGWDMMPRTGDHRAVLAAIMEQYN